MKTLHKSIGFALIILVWTLPGVSQAADYTVNVFDDPTPVNDPSPNINGCVSASINGGRCSLREAILAANVNGGPSSTITVPAGDYQLTITGSNEEFGLTGDLDILNHPLTIQGEGANVTTINATALADRIFDIPTTGVVEVNINALTLTGGDSSTSTINAGGAINILSVAAADTLNINECNIVSNTSSLGGGVRAGSANLNIVGSTIANNTSNGTGGGGVALGSTTATISNSTISGNVSDSDGAALWMSFSSATIRSSTIYNNQAEGVGGGIYAGFVAATLENVILSGNTAASGSADCNGITVTSNDYNIFGDVTDCGLTLATHDQTVATADLGLLSLDNYGGPTLTHQLESTSPAINTGSPTSCPDASGSPLTTDQRGQTRPSGANCDVGAVELGTADLTITNTASTEVTTVGSSIVNTIVVSNEGPDTNFNIVMTNNLPTSLVSFSSATSSNTSVSCAESSGVVTCSLSELASGDSFTVVVTTSATATGSGSNSASVLGTEIDTSPDISETDLLVTSSGGGGCSLGSPLPIGSMVSYILLGLGFFACRNKILKGSIP